MFVIVGHELNNYISTHEVDSKQQGTSRPQDKCPSTSGKQVEKFMWLMAYQ